MGDLTKELEAGDWFRFEQITVEARRMSKPILIQGTKSHKGIRVTFSKKGIIFVDKTWKFIGKK